VSHQQFIQHHIVLSSCTVRTPDLPSLQQFHTSSHSGPFKENIRDNFYAVNMD